MIKCVFGNHGAGQRGTGWRAPHKCLLGTSCVANRRGVGWHSPFATRHQRFFFVQTLYAETKKRPAGTTTVTTMTTSATMNS